MIKFQIKYQLDCYLKSTLIKSLFLTMKMIINKNNGFNIIN